MRGEVCGVHESVGDLKVFHENSDDDVDKDELCNEHEDDEVDRSDERVDTAVVAAVVRVITVVAQCVLQIDTNQPSFTSSPSIFRLY